MNRAAAAFQVLVFAALAASCVHYPRLRRFDGWQISARNTTKMTSTSAVRTGHLLIAGPAVVLLTERVEGEFTLATDSDTCDIIRVQLAAPLKVGRTDKPVAYSQHGGCVLGPWAEESLTAGTVEIRQVTDSSVTATLDLQFPSLRLQKTAVFTKAAPDKEDTEPEVTNGRE